MVGTPLSPAAGANLANGWMLRPGASVIEILPYQFEDGRGATVFSTTNGKVRRQGRSGPRVRCGCTFGMVTPLP